MTLGSWWRGVPPCITMCLVVPGCGWKELDAISSASLAVDAQGLDAASDAAASDVRDSDVRDSDVRDEVDAPTGVPEAGVSSLACSGDQTATIQWTFDSAIEGWILSLDTGVDASLEWIGTTGDPSPGALQVEITPYAGEGGAINGGWLQYNTALGDLAGRIVSAWVYLDSGTSPALKVFVQTGTQYEWADNGTVTLAPRAWTCVSLPISTPAYNQPNYDPTAVIRVGLQLLGSAPFQLYVDTVRIY
jgi:hypothetical protein